MEKIVVNGETFEIPVEVKDTLDVMFNALEGLRVQLCAALGLDYIEATDLDILDAIKKGVKMRTVLDRATIVFEEGFNAYNGGIPRSHNPYNDGKPDQTNWFDGWDYGRAVWRYDG